MKLDSNLMKTKETYLSVRKTIRNLFVISAIFCAAILVIGNINKYPNSNISNKVSDWEISGTKDNTQTSSVSSNSKANLIDLTNAESKAVLADNSQPESHSETQNQPASISNTPVVQPKTTQKTADTSTPSQSDANILDQELINKDNLDL